jgi:hypothetical protein
MTRLSEAFRSQQGNDKVDQKAYGGQESDKEFRHGTSLDPLAAGDVRGGKDEEEQRQRDEGDVGHLEVPGWVSNMSPA